MNVEEKIKVQLYPSAIKIHTGWKSLVSNPPDGYEFVGASETKKSRFIEWLKKYNFVRSAYHSFLSAFKTTSILNIAFSVPDAQDAKLVYSLGHIYYGDKPYVLDIMDIPYGLAGNSVSLFRANVKKIESVLLRKNCKKILCPHESAFELMKKYFSHEVIEKCIIVPQAIKPIEFAENKEKYKKKTGFQILFMGSINNPQDFYMKGGYETIAAFEKLPKKYNATLVVRCKVPEDIKDRIRQNEKIKLLEEQLPYDKIVQLYVNSDIFLYPGHTYALMVFLESMYFGLPIITIDTYATPDYIKNGINGIIVEKSLKLSVYNAEDYPNNLRTNEFADKVKIIEHTDSQYINRIASAVENLLKNPALRKKMAQNAMKGAKIKFSIEARNTQIKKIFDDII